MENQIDQKMISAVFGIISTVRLTWLLEQQGTTVFREAEPLCEMSRQSEEKKMLSIQWNPPLCGWIYFPVSAVMVERLEKEGQAHHVYGNRLKQRGDFGTMLDEGGSRTVIAEPVMSGFQSNLNFIETFIKRNSNSVFQQFL